MKILLFMSGMIFGGLLLVALAALESWKANKK